MRSSDNQRWHALADEHLELCASIGLNGAWPPVYGILEAAPADKRASILRTVVIRMQMQRSDFARLAGTPPTDVEHDSVLRAPTLEDLRVVRQTIARYPSKIHSLDVRAPSEPPMARGGGGAVYQISHPLHGRCALKVLNTDPRHDPTRRDEPWWQALAEGRRSAELHSLRPDLQTLIRVFDAGLLDGDQPAIIMEWIDGGSLASECVKARDTELSAPCLERAHRTIRMMRDVCSALAIAHEELLIHRDIKPSNILIRQIGCESEQPVFVLTDFGCARELAYPTSVGAHPCPGTELYMAPEQRGGGVPAPSWDIYALGATAYEYLSGQAPFAKATVRERDALKQFRRVPAILTRHQRTCVSMGDAESIILKCLWANPAQRYPSAIDLRDDCERWLKGNRVSAHPHAFEQRVIDWRHRRHRSLLRAAMIASVAAISVLIAVFTGPFRTLRSQIVRAEQRSKTVTAAAERQSYTAQLREAERSFHAGDLYTSRRHLDACPEAYRAWEWRFLDGQLASGPEQFVPPERSFLWAAFLDESTLVAADSDPIGLYKLDRRASGKDRVKLLKPEVFEFNSPASLDMAGNQMQICASSGTIVSRGTGNSLLSLQIESGERRQHEQQSDFVVYDVADHPPRALVGFGRPYPRNSSAVRVLFKATQKKLSVIALDSGNVIGTQISTDSIVITAGFAANGAEAVAVLAGGQVCRYNVGSGARIGDPLAVPLPKAASVSDDGSRVAVVDKDQVLQLFRIHDGQSEGPRLLCLRNQPVLSPDGNLVLGFGDTAARNVDGNVCVPGPLSFPIMSQSTQYAQVYDVSKARFVGRQFMSPVMPIGFSPDSRSIAVQDERGGLGVFPCSDELATAYQVGLPNHALVVRWDGTGERLVSVEQRGLIQFINLRTGNRTSSDSKFASYKRAIAVRPTGGFIVLGQEGWSLSVCDDVHGNATVLDRERHFSAVDVNPLDNVHAYAVFNDATQRSAVRVRMNDLGGDTQELGIFAGRVHGLQWHPEGRELAVFLKTHFEVWDVGSKRRLWKADHYDPPHTTNDHGMKEELRVGRALEKVHELFVIEFAYSPDGVFLASGGSDGRVRVWDARTGALFATSEKLTTPIESLEWSRDGSRLLIGVPLFPVSWPVNGGTTVRFLVSGEVVRDIAYSPDATRVVTACSDGSARIFDAMDGTLLLTIKVSQSAVTWARFNPDAKRLATASEDGILRIFAAP